MKRDAGQRRGSNQRGVALITALLVVALATIAAVAMTTRQQLDIRRTQNLFQADQAYLYAKGGEHWARGLLYRDTLADRKRENRLDYRGEAWAKPLAITEIEHGRITAALEDLQGRYNLNNLYFALRGEDPQRAGAELAYLHRLLVQLELEPQLAQTISDWLDPDNQVRFPGGAEDAAYLDRDRPYRTANGPLADPSELRAIKGIDSDVYARLGPYVSALPRRTAINVNTAPTPVLAALAEGLGVGELGPLTERRDEEPFPSVEAFVTALNGTTGMQFTPADFEGMLRVSSLYFASRVDVELGRARLRLHSLLYRGPRGETRVLARSRGVQ